VDCDQTTHFHARALMLDIFVAKSSANSGSDGIPVNSSNSINFVRNNLAPCSFIFVGIPSVWNFYYSIKATTI